MNTRRLDAEVAALRDVYTVGYDREAGLVDLKAVQLPSGWTPRTATFRYDVPVDYEASPPTVHIPEWLRFHGRPVGRMRSSPHPHLKKWCVSWGWDPRRHTIITCQRELLQSMSYPQKSRLFQE